MGAHQARSESKTRRSKIGTFTKKNNKTFFGYKDHTIFDGKISVPMIRSYAVSTAKDHDTTVDL